MSLFPPMKPPPSLQLVPPPLTKARLLVEDCGVRVVGNPPMLAVPYPRECCGPRFNEAVRVLGLEGMKFEYRSIND